MTNAFSKKTASILLVFILVVFFVAVGTVAKKRDGGEDERPLRIVMANDIPFSSFLWVEAKRDYGMQVEIDRGGDTVELSRKIANGELGDEYDAVWLATNSYVNLQNNEALGESYGLASDTLGLALRSKDLDRLGWRKKQVTWNDVREVVTRGDLTFGMADPGKSNLGMQSLIGILYKIGGLQSDDLAEEVAGKVHPQLKKFFGAQVLLSDTSDELYDRFSATDDVAQAVFAFSSDEKLLRDNGEITFVIPADRIGFNDFPISVIKNPDDEEAEASAHAKTKAFADWITQHGNELRDKIRVELGDSPGQRRADTTTHKLPSSKQEFDNTLRFYREELLRPRDINLLVDVSASMQGENLREVKKDVLDLLGEQAGVDGRAVNITTSSTSSSKAFTQKDYSPDDPKHAHALKDYVDRMAPRQEANIYYQLYREYLRIPRRGNLIQGQSIVLLTSGTPAKGVDYAEWSHELRYRERKEGVIFPVYIVHYGNENAEDMQRLAEETGGEVFKAKEGGLATALDRASKYWAT